MIWELEKELSTLHSVPKMRLELSKIILWIQTLMDWSEPFYIIHVYWQNIARKQTKTKTKPILYYSPWNLCTYWSYYVFRSSFSFAWKNATNFFYRLGYLLFIFLYFPNFLTMEIIIKYHFLISRGILVQYTRGYIFTHTFPLVSPSCYFCLY